MYIKQFMSAQFDLLLALEYLLLESISDLHSTLIQSVLLYMKAPKRGPGRKQFFIEKLAFFGRNTLLLCEER